MSLTIFEVFSALGEGKKITRGKAPSGRYIELTDMGIIDNTGKAVPTDKMRLRPDWEIYEPPKPKKKYWQWKVCDTYGWHRPHCYYDDDGVDTAGDQNRDWDGVEKIKIEEDFVEV